jgi:hypothetical protein
LLIERGKTAKGEPIQYLIPLGRNKMTALHTKRTAVRERGLCVLHSQSPNPMAWNMERGIIITISAMTGRWKARQMSHLPEVALKPSCMMLPAHQHRTSMSLHHRVPRYSCMYNGVEAGAFGLHPTTHDHVRLSAPNFKINDTWKSRLGTPVPWYKRIESRALSTTL